MPRQYLGKQYTQMLYLCQKLGANGCLTPDSASTRVADTYKAPATFIKSHRWQTPKASEENLTSQANMGISNLRLNEAWQLYNISTIVCFPKQNGRQNKKIIATDGSYTNAVWLQKLPTPLSHLCHSKATWAVNYAWQHQLSNFVVLDEPRRWHHEPRKAALR